LTVVPLIRCDRKIHTPIRAMKGSHATSSETIQGTWSPAGRAVINIPFW
jgi:hypothetical protein